MKETKGKRWELPGIGMRIVKSAVAVFLCFVVSVLRGDAGIVFYSQLAALWCMQSYRKDTKGKAIQRTIGTVIGALYGLVVLLLTDGLQIDTKKQELLYGLLISVMILLILYTTVVLKKNQASYFSCVVFLSIVVNHVTDANAFLFVWNRFLDTMIGILIGILVNEMHLPVERDKKVLFVSGLDDTLLNKKDNMSPYSRVELNRMISDGALFTISTIRTPAALMEVTKDIQLKLPVIAMDGAVLYDIEKKRYLREYVISHNKSREILDFIHSYGLTCYANVIIDDMLVIYYEKNLDEVNQKMMEHLRCSPYRNYVRRPLPDGEEVVYFMLLHPKEQILPFYQRLSEHGYDKELKILCYDSEDYPGYAYIKIYNKNASKVNMMQYLCRTLEVERVMTFGSIEGQYTQHIEPGDSNGVVKMIKKNYETLHVAKIF